MSARTAWIAGNGVGLAWSPLFNSSDLQQGGSPLPTGSTVLSSVADITNGTALDMEMDISFALFLGGNSTIAGGATHTFYLYALNQDGVHYGDGLMTSGSTTSVAPSMPPAAVIGTPAQALTTPWAMYGYATGIVIPPGSYRMAYQNNSGFTLGNVTQTVKYRTYNINLNS